MKKSILLIAVVILFGSCKNTKKIAELSVNEIPSGKYEIRTVQGATIYKLSFDIDSSGKKLSGKTNCNTYSGPFSINNNEIKIGPLAVTKMYCEENVMEVERSIFKAFAEAKTYLYDNNMFTLSSENGVILRAFKVVKK